MAGALATKAISELADSFKTEQRSMVSNLSLERPATVVISVSDMTEDNGGYLGMGIVDNGEKREPGRDRNGLRATLVHI